MEIRFAVSREVWAGAQESAHVLDQFRLCSRNHRIPPPAPMPPRASISPSKTPPSELAGNQRERGRIKPERQRQSSEGNEEISGLAWFLRTLGTAGPSSSEGNLMNMPCLQATISRLIYPPTWPSYQFTARAW